MRIGRLTGRPVLVLNTAFTFVDEASGGRFRTSRDIFEEWEEFLAWHEQADITWSELAVSPDFQAPHDRPGQIFGVGLNYAEHRDEVAQQEGYTDVGLPLTFTKFPSSIAGPHDDIELSSDRCDYEVELVIVIGRTADRISPDEGWDHVAGLTVGQDISDRGLQYANPNQLSLGKSMRTFSPIGPLIVTPDEFADRDDIAFECLVNGEQRQKSTTGMLIRDVGETVSFLSRFTALRPGDLIFSGTPVGIGHRREPPVFLAPGDVITSRFEGIGEMVNHCVPGFNPIANESEVAR